METIDEEKEKIRAYRKEYYEKNIERIKAYQNECNAKRREEKYKAYQKECGEKNKAYQKEYKEKNSEKNKVYQKEYYKKNKEKLLANLGKKVKCELCGSEVCKYNFEKHLSSKLCFKKASMRKKIEDKKKLLRDQSINK